MFEVQESDSGIAVYIKQERLDLSVANKLLNDLQELLGRPGQGIVLNLRDVNYMDSSVLGILVTFQKKIKEADKKLVVTGLSPSIQKVFELTKLNLFFTIK